jgi:hypothetical protein
MEWHALSDLQGFLINKISFDRKVLTDLTILVCARQKSRNQLAIWIKADEEVNPISIEIFDDAYGILGADGIEQDALKIFSEESDRVSQEFVDFDEEDEMARYDVDFPTDDVDLEGWIEQIASELSAPLAAFQPVDKLEEIFKQFCLRGIESESR